MLQKPNSFVTGHEDQIPIMMTGNPPQMHPSSEVVRGVPTWEEEVMLIPHEAFRMYFKWMILAINNFHPKLEGEEWKATQFFSWYRDWFHPALLHHHHAEEEIFFPYIAEKTSPFPEKMTKDHDELIRLTEDVLNKEQEFDEAAGDPSKLKKAVSALKISVEKLISHTSNHLKEEEQVMPKKIQEGNLTKEVVDEGVTLILKDLGMKGNAKLLPPILYAMQSWGGEEIVAAFRTTIPPPIRLLNDKFWDQTWRSKCLAVIHAIITGNNTEINDFCSCSLM